MLAVPLSPVPWPKRPERVSINSFGMGGANAHVILESASSWGISSAPSFYNGPRPILANGQQQLIVLSANRPDSLDAMIDKHRDYILKQSNSFEDIAYTLARRRQHLRYRAYALMDGSGGDVAFTKGSAPSRPALTFVFTGQGAQWPQMGMALIKAFDSVADVINRMDAKLDKISPSRDWTIKGIALPITTI